MVREDLIEGAITFLQDPSVATAPVEQRIAFLRSKNLTQEEIDVSLARAGGQSAPPQSSQQQPYPRQQYPSYPQQQPYWPQQPPLEPPRRDWRDYFILATVVSTLGYGAYWAASRYIAPLIAPPTPPQLEQDKASIDASFEKTFALLDQLASDTKALQEAEKSRTERLDAALGEVESVLQKLKTASESQDVENKRTAKELQEIRELVPQAVAKDRETTDGRLRDLGTEMKSLKTLVASRMQQPPPATNGEHQSSRASDIPSRDSTYRAPAIPDAPATNGSALDKPAPTPSSVLPERSAASTPYGRFSGAGKAPAIPAWQLAAKKRNEEVKAAETSTNGTGTQASVEEETGAGA